MPLDNNPDIVAVATTAAFGAAGGGIVALSKPMSRREVYFNIFGAVIFAATIPQLVVHYTGMHPMASWLLGVLCGLSVPLIINRFQALTDGWLKKKSDELTGGKS